MMLGDLLAIARSASGTFEAWLEDSDPKFAREVRQVADAQGLSVTGYVRGAIADVPVERLDLLRGRFDDLFNRHAKGF